MSSCTPRRIVDPLLVVAGLMVLAWALVHQAPYATGLDSVGPSCRPACSDDDVRAARDAASTATTVGLVLTGVGLLLDAALAPRARRTPPGRSHPLLVGLGVLVLAAVALGAGFTYSLTALLTGFDAWPACLAIALVVVHAGVVGLVGLTTSPARARWTSLLGATVAAAAALLGLLLLGRVGSAVAGVVCGPLALAVVAALASLVRQPDP